MTAKEIGPEATVRWVMENGDHIDVRLTKDWNGNQALRMTTVSRRVPSLTVTPITGNSIYVRAGDP